ncbi:uncharacterized protein EHS24_000151 [Apiotrichum porosum]|uniref:Zn(2)-C6 fungal-type domain-containing protein n=1 Tax=Apiotrichum porosum TaxID=105984 RepID=A0A427Y949_9TREE|nr:uncharacterized protein EHS24_000151 [Apiotrichum porosum]RSH87638.1 hypothetical protein EHS24_000151 [Apiotrichum porosum]
MIPAPIESSSLPSLSTLLRRPDTANTQSSIAPAHTPALSNPRQSTGSSCSPSSSPRTPRSINMDGPSPNFGPMGVNGSQGGMMQDGKRRPAPLTTLPSLSQLPRTDSVPLTRKPSDERRNIAALLNEPRRHDDYFSHQPQSHAPPHTPPHYQQQHPHHHQPPPHHHPHAMHHDPMGVPPGPPSAPLVHPDARYYAPERYDYRPPTAPHPHPYGRPEASRRHTSAYHTVEYPPYYDIPQYPPGLVGMPFDANMGARAPISRTTKACDACRARKVRCDAGGHPGSTGTCSRCRESGRVCVYTATQKKRGPCPGRPATSRVATSTAAANAASSAAAAANAGRRGSLESARDRRTWSAGHGPVGVPTSAPPHQQEWPYSYPPSAQYEAEVRHHPYRVSPGAGSGPRTAPLVVERERGPGGWDAEPRHAPAFDAGYLLRPHPSAGWPTHRRGSYAYAPEYRRSISPQPVRLAPLRRE